MALGEGCDKTTPAQLMGGLSANKPILHLVTGPMMPGSHKGVRIGACTDCRNNWAAYRAGTIDIEDISAINNELAPTVSETHSRRLCSRRESKQYYGRLLTRRHNVGRNVRCHGHRKHNGMYPGRSRSHALDRCRRTRRVFSSSPRR